MKESVNVWCFISVLMSFLAVAWHSMGYSTVGIIDIWISLSCVARAQFLVDKL